MEEMIPDIRLILGVLGFPLLDPLIKKISAVRTEVHATEPSDGELSLLDREFVFTGPTFSARGRITDEGFVVLQGSIAAPEFKSGSEGYRRFREKLITEGALVEKEGRFEFVRDVATSSSSQAASVVAGGNRNGPGSWRSEGKTINELEAVLASL